MFSTSEIVSFNRLCFPSRQHQPIAAVPVDGQCRHPMASQECVDARDPVVDIPNPGMEGAAVPNGGKTCPVPHSRWGGYQEGLQERHREA